MKKITRLLAALLLGQLVYSCAADSLIDTDTPTDAATPRRITVKAFLPSEAESRAQIAYGCQDTTREVFMWNKEDTINIINISKLAAYPYGVEGLRNLSIDGHNATFESVEPTDMAIDAGDVIFAIYGNGVFRRKYNSDATFDERNIFTIDVGTESNKPQYIVGNPDNSTLAYMRDNLKMYDIVVAEKDGEVPDLHFKHLSAIMRVTLHNATGKDLYPTKLEFKYPSVTGTESFFNSTLYCSVTGDNPDNFGLIAHISDDIFKGSDPYTANIGTTINGKDGTADAGESIPAGESYELYLSTLPRINNDSYGDGLTIHLIASHDTHNPYAITLDGFNEVITAGKRYWFDLTATPEGTLMLTSQWKKLQQTAN
ncbi:MAG: hypothetical protein K2K37_12435 [Muribaculaceae bacterium]|nr:hypothetical protein [Muribaculaceae bacterium]